MRHIKYISVKNRQYKLFAWSERILIIQQYMIFKRENNFYIIYFRNVALKLLNERLSKSDQPSKWPSMDDDDQTSPVSPGSVDSAPPPDTKSPSVRLPIPDFKENQVETEANPQS